MDLSGPCPGLAMTVMTLLPSLEEILRPPPKLGLFLLLPSTKEVVRGREELMAVAAMSRSVCQVALTWFDPGGFRPLPSTHIVQCKTSLIRNRTVKD